MQKNQARFLDDITRTCGYLWEKGWAERNAGNVSVRLRQEDLAEVACNRNTPWQKLPQTVSNLGGESFLITGTGRYLKNVPLNPAANLGVIELDPSGAQYRVIWGYTDGARPTSELPSHLQAHATRKQVTNGADRVIIHTHPTNLVALTYGAEWDTPGLTRMLWEMHTESLVVFPEGVEFLPWMVPGSNEIGTATARAFEKRSLVVWQFHGIFATGPNLDVAFGLIDTVEKVATIYNAAMAAGGVRKRLSGEQLAALAKAVNLHPDPDIFSGLTGRDSKRIA